MKPFIADLVSRALQQLVSDGVLTAADIRTPVIERARDPAHGDFATNAAMVLAKPAGLKPRDIATALAAKLADDPRIASAEVAGLFSAL